MNTNVSGHQHIYLVQESYLPLAQYSEISSAIFSITKLAISGEVCHQTLHGEGRMLMALVKFPCFSTKNVGLRDLSRVAICGSKNTVVGG